MYTLRFLFIINMLSVSLEADFEKMCIRDSSESVLSDAENKLKELKAVVYSESMKTDDYFAQTLNVLGENIQELRMRK